MLRASFCIAGVAMLLAPAVSVRAADKAPVWATGCLDSARDSFTKDSRVPEGYQRSEIEKLLFPASMVVSEDRVEVPWLLFVKLWKASPGLSVAVLETLPC